MSTLSLAASPPTSPATSTPTTTSRRVRKSKLGPIALFSRGVPDLIIDGIPGMVFILALASDGIFRAALLIPAFIILVASFLLNYPTGRIAIRRASSVFNLDIPDWKLRRTEGQLPLSAWWRSMKTPRYWTVWLHTLLTGFLGVITWTCATLIAGALALAAAPLYASSDSRVLQGLGIPVAASAALAALCPLLGVVVLYLLCITHRFASRTLLAPTDLDIAIAERNAAAEARTRTAEGAATERSRLERDLHDGVQPQLVAAAMTMSMARSRIEADPEGAAQLLDEAHATTKAAITELRHLARGYYPAVLADRGLDAALSSLAAQCTIPVTLDVEMARRCSAETEAAAYFVIAEALTNAVKHSGARTASVTVRLLDNPSRTNPGEVETALSATINDDGIGGAQFVPGGGLAGSRDRVLGAGGRFDLYSPASGPTRLTVEVPCKSW